MPTPEIVGSLLIRLLGAVLGAILALLRFPPANRSEAFRRAVASIIAGFVSASVVSLRLGLGTGWDELMFSAMLTSYLTWGVLKVADKIAAKSVEKNTDEA